MLLRERENQGKGKSWKLKKKITNLQKKKILNTANLLNPAILQQMKEGTKQKRALSNPPATKYIKSLSTPNILRTPQRVVGDKVRKITLKHKNKEIGRIEEELFIS